MSDYIGTREQEDEFIGSRFVEAAYKGSTKYYDAYSEVSGSLPLAYESRVEHVLKNYALYGSASGAGVETKNLFDKETVSAVALYPSNAQRKILLSTGGARSFVISIDGGQSYTISKAVSDRFRVCTTESEPAEDVACSEVTIQDNARSITVSTDASARYLMVYFTAAITSAILEAVRDSLVIVEGPDTPETYVPHGYQIHLTDTGENSQSETYPLYIGSTKLGEEEYLDYESGKVYKRTEIKGLSEPLCAVNTIKDVLDLTTGTVTRRIKKLVLKGTEAIYNYNYGNKIGFYVENVLDVNHNRAAGICTHSLVNGNEATIGYTVWNGVNTRSVYLVGFGDALGITGLTAFKSWLASQYALGTPVTIWYVTNPWTETVQIPAGLTGAITGTVNSAGIPTPNSPVEPTFNGELQQDETYSVYTPYPQPTDPPVPFPAITAYKGENTLSSTETVGLVTVKGRINEPST